MFCCNVSLGIFSCSWIEKSSLDFPIRNPTFFHLLEPFFENFCVQHGKYATSIFDYFEQCNIIIDMIVTIRDYNGVRNHCILHIKAKPENVPQKQQNGNNI